ncbi:YdeI/OmpD-associated family protein [Sinomicrobium pectinilyticum]
MNPDADTYFSEGCGRCPLGGTPGCKVHKWTEELEQLRSIVLDCGLTEERKWGVPCYTFQKNNVVIIGAFKDYCALSFFKGALLNDAGGILRKPGKNTQSGRIIPFTERKEIAAMETLLKTYIHEAIEVEKAGLKMDFKKNPEPVPEELQDKFEEIPVLKTAFEALTPGRQRGYILHFSGARQSATRKSRIEKCIPKILSGKGLHDR